VILHGDEASPAVALRHREQTLELPCVHRAGADVPNLALRDQVIEGGHHLFHRCVRIEAVDLIEVDRVDAQTAEAVLTGLLDVLP
jgi:hypothetical protein